MKAPSRYQQHIIYLDQIILPIAEAIGRPNETEYVLTLVRSVLNSLSRCLAFPQAVQLFNALPTPLQALMVEEWVIEQYLPERFMNLDDVLEQIASNAPAHFEGERGKQLALELLMAMMEVASHHISPAELQQLLTVFPLDLQERFAAYNLLQRKTLSENIN